MHTAEAAGAREDEAASPATRRLFKSPLAGSGASSTAKTAAVPSRGNSRADGLNPLIRRVIQEHGEMTHCHVSECADVATDGALIALCDALVAHQQAHLVQIDLRGCGLMSDAFARTGLLDTVRKLPRLRHVRLDGCEQLSAETLRDFNQLFRTRAEERAVDQALADVSEKGSMLAALRGKELSDEAAFRLVDCITSAGPDSAIATQLRTIDLRDNNLTDDAAMYLLPVLANDATAVTSVLLQGNAAVSEDALNRIAKAAARKKVVVQLDQATGSASRPYTTTAVRGGPPIGGLSPVAAHSRTRSIDPAAANDGMDDSTAAHPAADADRPLGPGAGSNRRLAQLRSRPQTQSSTRTGGTGSFYNGRYQQRPTLVGEL